METKLAHRGPSGLSHLGSEDSRDGQTGCWTAVTVAKGAQRESWKTTLGSQWTYKKTGMVTTPKKGSTYLYQKVWSLV
jgi:hypothetical protein